MGTRTVYPPEVKQAALAALAAGTSATEVAIRYSVASATVRAWKARELRDLQFTPTVARDERAEFGQRVLTFLQEEINALRAQAQLFTDPEWLRTQNAHDLAILHGVCVDKTAALLQAIESRDDDAGAGADAAL